MDSSTSQTQDAFSADEAEVRRLYTQWLQIWNERRADGFTALLAEDANLVGFDGSLVDGRAEIVAHVRQVFEDHVTAAYVGKVRAVRFLSAEVALLRAVAGMIPPGKSDLNPAVNTIQTLVALREAGSWRVVLFQNTPAQFHGRPDLAQQLTDELRELL